MNFSAINQRVFALKYNNIRGDAMTGTGFTIDWRNQEYLVTAHHVVDGVMPRDCLRVFYEEEWRGECFSRIGTGPLREDGDGQVDVAVLKLGSSLPVAPPVVTSSDGLPSGARVYTLGFPSHEGVVSAMRVEVGTYMDTDSEGRLRILGEPAHGMSGGPVVFVPEGQAGEELRVVGIFAEHDHPGTSPTVVAAYDIRRAIELIDANPLGQ